MGEIVISGLNGVDKGQVEGAKAIGVPLMTKEYKLHNHLIGHLYNL